MIAPYWKTMRHGHITHLHMRQFVCSVIGHSYRGARYIRQQTGHEGCACVRCGRYDWFKTP